MQAMRTILFGAVFAAVTLSVSGQIAHAHPLGNENIEHFNALWIYPDRLEIDYMLLIAEVPSMRVREAMDTDRDDVASPEEQQAWLARQAVEFRKYLKATLDGQPIEVRLVEAEVDPDTGQPSAPTQVILEAEGFAGMPTFLLLIRYEAPYPSPLAEGRHTIHFEDATYPQQLGLKRILLWRVPGIEFIPPHPDVWDEVDDPRRYEQYDPADLPQEREATVNFRVTIPPERTTTPPATGPSDATPAEPDSRQESPPSAGEPPPTEGDAEPRRPDYFYDAPELASRQGQYEKDAERLFSKLKGPWGLVPLLSVIALAFVWGAGHALMPGHAKTVVAAYLISQRGTYVHAILLAIVVTLTHTALVVVLGIVLAVYKATNPELGPKLQNWLGVVSGLLIAAMGLVLIWRALSGRLAHHHHDHDHHHHDDDRPWWRKLFTHSHPHVPGHTHDHGHEHAHDHSHAHHHSHDHEHGRNHAHSHDHSPDHQDSHAHTHEHQHEHEHERAPVSLEYAGRSSVATDASRPLSFKSILTLGIAGGIVPCPTATIIMFLGIGADIVLRALFAVAVFSLGLALTLMAVGFAALTSRRFAARLLADEQRGQDISGRGQWFLLKVMPTASGLVVVLLGAAIAANYIHYMSQGSALFSWLG